MEMPFTIIRGGLLTGKPPPTEFAHFDRSRAIIDRLKGEIVAERDRAILVKRHKAKSP